VIDPLELIGRRLDAVTGSWLHHPDGSRSLLHVWLRFDTLGPIRLCTPSHDVTLELNTPHDSYAMDECGHVVVESAPPDFTANRFVGKRVEDGGHVHEPLINASIGFVLHFDDGILRVRNVCDELAFDTDQPRPRSSGSAARTAEADLRSVVSEQE